MKRFLFYILIGSFFLSGCKTLVPFTENLRDTNRWGENEIKQIQFYTSSAITLRRQISSNETTIESGKIKMVDGKQVEEIVIPSNTPGIAVKQPDGERLAVSFEISDDYFLTFGINPKRGERFYLLGKEWKNKIGKITYNERIYLSTPESADVFLMVNMKKIKKIDKDERVAGGRKL